VQFLVYSKRVFFVMMVCVYSTVSCMDPKENQLSHLSPLVQFFGVDVDRYNAMPLEIQNRPDFYDISHRQLWYCDWVISYPTVKSVPKNPWEGSYNLPCRIFAVCFDTVHSHLIVAKEKSVHTYDINTKKQIGDTFNFDGIVHSLCRNDMSNCLAIGSEDTNAYVMDEGEEFSLKHDSSVISVGCDSVGKYLVTGSQCSKAHVFDMKTKQCITRFFYNSPVYGVSFSRSGGLLAIAESNTVHIITAETWEELVNFVVLEDETVYSVCLNPSGDYLAIGTNKGKLYIYNVQTEELYVSFNFQKHGSVNSICFNNSGNYVTLGMYSKACIIDMQTKQEIVSFDHDNCVWSVCFDPSGTRLATGEKQKARMFALFNTCTLQQLMMLKIMSLWTRVCKQSHMIDTVEGCFSAIANMFTVNKKGMGKIEAARRVDLFYNEMSQIWKTLPEDLQHIIWKPIRKVIQQYAIYPCLAVEFSGDQLCHIC
jgi:hypothetical protein